MRLFKRKTFFLLNNLFKKNFTKTIYLFYFSYNLRKYNKFIILLFFELHIKNLMYFVFSFYHFVILYLKIRKLKMVPISICFFYIFFSFRYLQILYSILRKQINIKVIVVMLYIFNISCFSMSRAEIQGIKIKVKKLRFFVCLKKYNLMTYFYLIYKYA